MFWAEEKVVVEAVELSHLRIVAMEKIKSGKAPGPDGAPPEAVIWCIQALPDGVLRLVKKLLAEEVVTSPNQSASRSREPSGFSPQFCGKPLNTNYRSTHTHPLRAHWMTAKAPFATKVPFLSRLSLSSGLLCETTNIFVGKRKWGRRQGSAQSHVVRSPAVNFAEAKPQPLLEEGPQNLLPVAPNFSKQKSATVNSAPPEPKFETQPHPRHSPRAAGSTAAPTSRAPVFTRTVGSDAAPMPKTTVSLDKETTAAIFKSIIEAVTVPVAKLTPRDSSPLAATTTTTNQGSTAAPKIRETEGSTVTSTPATEFRPASKVQPPMNTTVSVQTAVAGAVGSHVAPTPRTTASLDKEALEKGTPKRHDSPLAAKSEDTATSTPLQVSACPASVSMDVSRPDEDISEGSAADPRPEVSALSVQGEQVHTLPHLAIKTTSGNLQALLDTGSSHSLIQRGAHRGSTHRLPQTLQLKTAARQAPVTIHHSQVIECRIGEWKGQVEFLVVDQLAEEAILGYSFLHQQEAIIDTRRRCLYIGKEHARKTVFFQHQAKEAPSGIPRPILKLEEIEHGFPATHKHALAKVLQEFASVFDEEARPTTTPSTCHRIRLKTPQSFRIPPYRYSDQKKAVIYDQLELMLRDGIIEPSTSEFSSPIVVVKKKDGQPRFCIDYRKLNTQTVDEASALPRIDDTLRDLGQAKVFSTLDLRSGYWQIPMEDESRRYTAFTTPDGALYQFCVMPFGLKGAPGTFQRLMTQEVLPGYLHKFALVYLDDIVVFSNDYQSHLQHLRLILERLTIHGLRCNPGKCHFGLQELDYLGHHVGRDGNCPQQSHLEEVQAATRPRDRKTLRSFLGTCNWLRDYVPRFAEIAHPLTDLLSNKGKWKWGTKEEAAFEGLKSALAKPRFLYRPNPNLPFTLQTDASGIGMAAVLYQEDGTNRRVIAYASAKFSPTEQRYHVNEQECLALIWATRTFRPYLEDRKFKIRTDSRVLTWLQTTQNERAKLARWALELQHYNFELEHCPGRDNELPDFLSRNPSGPPISIDEDIERLTPPDRMRPAPLAR
ncbi:Retrovirus-related Pol polyprotein from transposon 17.6-like protein [Tribolium castaneum]|uniref:RNA-directed DNA polymerase n=1 Tax=Tribolium castaneum TaxID=7070 RepID=A0A139WKX9_TRICA|nr:Retrovirus-related Pol polyprotein from transposon 17.6-like protein [Tribolium castaneum]